MSPHVQIGVPAAIVLLKAVTLLLGGAITLFAWRAWQRTASPALRALAIGFGVVTLGGLLAGVLDLALPVGQRPALLVESAFTAAGFAVLLYSLYVE
jgi:hypothetical protein